MERRLSYDRYKGGTLYDNVWLVPKINKYDTSIRSDDRYHTVVQDDRLDLLAYRYFNDSRLWWIIAEYNDIEWIFDIKVGDVLRLPSYSVLAMELLV